MVSSWSGQVMSDTSFVSPVGTSPSDVLEINRADERYNAEMAARSGVAPEVVDYVEGLDVMVLKFVDGQCADAPRNPPDLRPGQTHRRRRARTARRGPIQQRRGCVPPGPSRWLAACRCALSEFPSESRAQPDARRTRSRCQSAANRAVSQSPRAYNFLDDAHRSWIIDFVQREQRTRASTRHDPGGGGPRCLNLRNHLCEGYFGEAIFTHLPLSLLPVWVGAVLANVGLSLYRAIQAVVSERRRLTGRAPPATGRQWSTPWTPRTCRACSMP